MNDTKAYKIDLLFRGKQTASYKNANHACSCTGDTGEGVIRALSLVVLLNDESNSRHRHVLLWHRGKCMLLKHLIWCHRMPGSHLEFEATLTFRGIALL